MWVNSKTATKCLTTFEEFWFFIKIKLRKTSHNNIFRGEEQACLLGTDAVRDGVDVPGRSLRLIVFDRVPWPRPDILHRARREAFERATTPIA